MCVRGASAFADSALPPPALAKKRTSVASTQYTMAAVASGELFRQLWFSRAAT
jgi:hypothetical protein